MRKEATELYRELTEAGIEVLWDDREARAGEKFADSRTHRHPAAHCRVGKDARGREV